MSDHLDLARKLVALSLFNPESKEATAAFKKARQLIAKHGIGQAELFATTEPKAWGLDDFMRAAERGRDLITMAKGALADPEVQKTVSAARDLGSGLAKGLAAIRKARSG